MTATIKALHQTHPKEFITGYRGTAPQLMEFNPYIHPLAREEAEVIKMEYPAIRHSNQRPRHFIEAYANFLGEKLGVDIPIKEFRPDIYVSNEEQRWDSQVKEITNIDHPFWIIVVGGKNDFTVKWWDHLRYQQVVNHFRGKICFVRVGANNHYHPYKGSNRLTRKNRHTATGSLNVSFPRSALPRDIYDALGCGDPHCPSLTQESSLRSN